MPSAFLNDRGVVCVTGTDACSFLQGLVTCNVAKVRPGEGAYGALLTPQGKITVDFIVTEREGAHWIDCPLALAPELAKRLRFYKLRANVEVTDLSATQGVAAVWGETSENKTSGLEADPRDPLLGSRVIGERQLLEAEYGASNAALYAAHCVALGIPSGGVDFAYGDTFPHEANLDMLHGVDFKKGCYVGQEVVSRVEHRGTARKRIVRVHFDSVTPATGTPVRAGEIEVGVIGSVAGDTGLALLRVDRAQEAGDTLMAGPARVRVDPLSSPATSSHSGK